MIELARALGLVCEPHAHRRRRRQLAEQDLQRVALVDEPRVVRAIDATHGADADQRLDLVVAADRGADERIDAGDEHGAAVEWTPLEVGPERRATDRAASQMPML